MVAGPDQIESTTDADEGVSGDAEDASSGFVARFRHFLPIKF